MLNGPNRITKAVQKAKLLLAEKATDPDVDLNKLDEGLAIEFDEHFEYQQLQAEAHAMQTISTDEALIIYNALGEVYGNKTNNGGWQPHVGLAEKIVITQMMAELLGQKLARAKATSTSG
jgi:hypothetical protein